MHNAKMKIEIERWKLNRLENEEETTGYPIKREQLRDRKLS